MLQIEAHPQDDGPEDVDGERAQREGRDACVQVQRDIVPEQAAQRGEDDGEDGASAPGFFRGGNTVTVRGPDGQEDGAEPAAPAQQDREAVEDLAGEGQREGRSHRVHSQREVRAEDKRRQAEGDGGDDGRDDGHEAVSAVAGDVAGLGGRDGQVVGQGEEGVPDEGGEGGEGAAEARRQADVQRDRLLDRLVLPGPLCVGVFFCSAIVTVVAILPPPLLAEQVLVLAEEAHQDAPAHVGPQHARDDRRAGVDGQRLQPEASQGAEDGEEDEVGDGVELRLELGARLCCHRRGGGLGRHRVLERTGRRSDGLPDLTTGTAPRVSP